MYKCPICDYKSDTLLGIRLHATRKHNGNYCPLCNKKYKNLIKHLMRVSKYDDDHKLLYVVLCKKIKKKKLVDYALDVLKV